MSVEQRMIKNPRAVLYDGTWKEVSAGSGNIYNIGEIDSNRYMLGLVYNIVDFRYVKITNIQFSIRFEAQNSLQGKGRLYTGGALYTTLGNLSEKRNYNKSGITSNAQKIDIDITKDASLFQNYPNDLVYILSWYPTDIVGGSTQYHRIKPYDCYIIVTYETYSPIKPDTLTPNGVNRHPESEITLNWRFLKNTSIPNEVQTGSILSYRVGNGTWIDININNALNQYTFAPNTFNNGDLIEWRVRTISVLGTSDYSDTAGITLASTPPLSPILVYPLNTAVDGSLGVLLEWRYNSQYDTAASRFDFRYRLNGGNWIDKVVDEKPYGYTDSILNECQVEWQVRSYGAMGDQGPWSETGTFWVIGMPEKPFIVKVEGGCRPEIMFSTGQVLSWEIELQNNEGNPIYNSGDVAYDGKLSHKINEILHTGDYSVWMRVQNEYGLKSEWSGYTFSVNITEMNPLKISVIDNNPYCVELEIDNTSIIEDNAELYIMRMNHKEDKEKNLDIININGEVGLFKKFITYKDYSAAPNVIYKYRVFIISEDGNRIAFSNIIKAGLKFINTAIMELNNADSLLLLDLMPLEFYKSMSVITNKRITKVIGNENSIVEIDHNSTRSFNFGFVFDTEQVSAINKLVESKNMLLLRDWRWGSIIGVITGNVHYEVIEGGKMTVHFTFSEVKHVE